MNFKIRFIIVILLTISVQTKSQYQKIILQASYDQILYPFLNFDYHKNANSYRVGGLVSYFFSNRISIGSGIHFETNNFNVQYPPPDSHLRFLSEEKNKYSYILFPLYFEFMVLESRSHSLSIQSGFELNRLLDYNVQKIYSNGEIENDISDINVHQNNMSFIVGPAYRYFFNEAYYLGFYPKFRYNLTSHGKTTGESTTISFVFQLAIGYSISLSNSPL